MVLFEAIEEIGYKMGENDSEKMSEREYRKVGVIKRVKHLL